MNMHNANINAQQNNGFKRGDKVEVVRGLPNTLKTGEIYTVESNDGAYLWLEKAGGGWLHKRFKLVEKKDEKPGFKPGDVVEYKVHISMFTPSSGKGRIGSRVPEGHTCGEENAWFVEVDKAHSGWAYYDVHGKDGNTHRAIPEADLKLVQNVPTAPFNEATGVIKLSASKPQPFKPGDKVVFKSADHIAKRFPIPSLFKRGITPDTVFTVDEAPARMKLLEGPTAVAIWTDAEIEKAKYCNGKPLAYVKTDLLKHHLEYDVVSFRPKGIFQTHIVCMYEPRLRGPHHLRPSANPKVHDTMEEAEKEARRLAAKHPDKRFMVLSSTFAVVNLPVAEL